MANITVDIQAKVVGYEASVKAFQAALAKVDPGSDIGKKLTSALTQAQKQIQDLAKNMFPKASSDQQIDAIVERVNRAGEALQNVATIFQSVDIKDLNIGALGAEFSNLQKEIQSITNTITSNLNTELVNAVENSNELKAVFESIGTDLSQATAVSLFEDLNNGAKDVTESLEKAQKEYDQFKSKIQKTQAELTQLEASPISNAEKAANLNTELKAIGNDYKKAFEDLRTTMSNNMEAAFKGKDVNSKKLLDTFFKDLTPDNIRQRIEDLFKELVSSNAVGAREKTAFYSQVFGLDNANINKVLSNINLTGARDTAKEKIAEFMATINDSLRESDKLQINDLLNENKITEALDKTKKIITSRLKEIEKEIQEHQGNLKKLEGDAAGAQTKVQNASAAQQNIDTARKNLEEQLRLAQEKNVDLSNKLVEAQRQIEALRANAVGGVHTSADTAGRLAGSSRFPTAQAEEYKSKLAEVVSAEQMVGRLQGVVQRWFSIYAAVRMVGNAIRSMVSTIKELDATITEIAIVTNKTQSELWGQMPEYTAMARKYAASISGVYKVSQLYYQQGLGQEDVMALSEQTLKMARISGLDYAQATDYMTNAVRSFKLEMQDASTVVDTYSAVAAKSATSVTELATAMSKTASSAQSVGASLQNTTAMMAVMIEATRESPENIGSAMKSIISRYGELKENKTGIDAEGEEYSLNKVDKALQTVGISIHDVKGEFRDFDDVIMELADSWDTIDKNTQRYIATVMAGNRQQSRFLALVSSGERLKELSDTAANSEDASQLQFLKTLDSVSAKTQQLETSLQSLYVNSGLENLYKGILDIGNSIATTLDSVSSNIGLVATISKISGTFVTLATLVTNIFRVLKTHFSNMQAQMTAEAQIQASKRLLAEMEAAGENGQVWNEETQSYITQQEVMTEVHNAELAKRRAAELKASTTTRNIGMAASAIGLATSTFASSINVNENRGLKAGLTGLSSILQGAGTGLMISGWAGALMGALSALPGIFEMLNMLSESTEDKVKRLQDEVEQTNNERIKSKDELKALTDYKAKYDELYKTRHESVEKEKEYKDLQNEIAEAYPTLIASMDAEGNYVVDMTDAYKQLAIAKRDAYSEAFVKNLSAEISGLNDIDYVLKTIYGVNSEKSQSFLGLKIDDYENLSEIFQASLKEAEQYKDKIIPRFETVTDQGVKTYQYDSGFVQMNPETKERMFFKDNLGGAGLGFTSSEKTDKALDAIMAGVYNAYIQSAVQGIAYEKVEVNTQAIFDEVAKQYANSPYSPFRENPDKYRKAVDYAAKNFSPEDYKRMVATNNANNFAPELRTNTIRAYNSDYINTLNSTLDSTLGEAGNKIQQYIIRSGLDKELDNYLKTNESRVGSWDSKKRVWIDEGYLTEEFYKGTGKNGINHNALWYQNELQNFDYLNNDRIEEIYEALGQNTYNSIKDSLSKVSGLSKEEFSSALETLQSAFTEQYGKIVDRYNQWAQQDLDKDIVNADSKRIIEKFSQLFGPEYLQGIQNQYEDILKNSGLGKNQKISQITSLNNIFTAIDALSPELKSATLNKIRTADLTSINGIYALIKALDDADLDFDKEGKDLKEQLQNLAKKLDANITTEISAYLDSLETAAEGMEKSLSSASSGMNVKDAQALADKLGKNLKDFTVRDGKFYFEDYDAIIEYYVKVDKEFEDSLNQAVENKIANYTALSSQFSSKTLMSEAEGWKDNDAAIVALKESFGISYTELMNYIKDFKDQTEFDDIYAYIANVLSTGLNQGVEVVKQWSTQQNAIAQLKTNGLEAFMKAAGLDTSLNEAQQEALLAAIKSQDFTSLDEATYQLIKPYISTLLSTFKGAQEKVLNSIIDTIGTGKSLSLTVDQNNIGELKQLQSQFGLFSDVNFDDKSIIGQQVSTIIENAADLENYIINQIQTVFKSDAERLEAYQKYHAQKYGSNRFENFGNISDSDITYEEFTNYLFKNKGLKASGLSDKYIANIADAYGLALAASGDLYVKNWETYINQLTIDLNELIDSGTASTAEINAARAALETARQSQQSHILSATKDLIENYQDITVEQQQAFADALDIDMSKLTDILYKTDSQGKTTLNIGVLKGFIENSANKLESGTREALLSMFANIADEYLKNITTATSLVSSGTSNREDIQKFLNSAKELGLTLTENVFSFDAVLKAWTLDPKTLINYIEAQAKELVNNGLLVEEEINNYIDKNVRETLANAINVSAFLSADNKTGQVRTELQNSLIKYLSVLDGAVGKTAQQIEADANAYIKQLENGGKDAVNVMHTIMAAQGKEASASDIADAYLSEIQQLEDAFEQLAYGPGSLISGKATEIINELKDKGYKTIDLGNGNAVITQIGDISDAYKAYYDKLYASNEATLAALNEAKAKILETQDGRYKEQAAINALGDAAGMTYTQFGSILADAGYMLTDELVEQFTESMGGNKMRIKNFAAFASAMGWSTDSEEYLSAFKTYNDSLIKLNRQTEKSIIDEVSALESAKGGDKINVTTLWSKVGTTINDELIKYGGYIIDGILTLHDDANIIGIAQALKSAAENAGVDLTDEVKQLADIVENVIKSYADAIRQGITGGLNSSQANNLQNIAASLGVGDLSFKETTEGLKLSQDSAIILYNTLSKVDSLQAKLIFDDLNKSLQESNEHYFTMSSTLNRIVELRSLKDTSDDTKRAQYEAELAVAEQIARVRATTEDSSFNFMSNKIPSGQNNPLNYFNNWATAIQKLQTAMKTKSRTSDGKTHKGLIDYQDWYNIVTELNNLAGRMSDGMVLGKDIEGNAIKLDGSLESASALIQKGASALTVDAAGNIKVALGDIGIKFKAGAGEMSTNIDAGIDLMADSQISMLDGMIALLEAIVTMQDLENIDTENNGEIDITELFPKFSLEGINYLTTDLSNWAQKIIDADPKSDLGKALDSIMLNGVKIRDWVQKAKTEGLNGQDAQDFTKIINSLYKMYTGDWDINDVYSSLQQLGAAAGFNGELILGDSKLIVEQGATVLEVKDSEGNTKYQTPDGTTYPDLDQALGAAMLQSWKGQNITTKSDGTVEATVPINGGITIAYNPKEKNVTVNGQAYATLNEYIDDIIKQEKLEGTAADQRRLELQLELGIKTLDSISYRAINEELRKELEQAFANGDVIKINSIIDENDIFSSLRGLSPEAIAKQLGIETINTTITTDNDQALSGISNVKTALEELDGKHATVTIDETTNKTVIVRHHEGGIDEYGEATGNVGRARAAGTLMGELGPELVVSNGRYFVAGQNGPEMVSLADDAIVFNHLQTKSLLEKGTSSGRGRAITSERKAVAYARGNVHGGPAKASAQAALNALKELRAQWQALKGLSAKDLAQKAGGGGGGKNDAAFIKQLERWYNLLQEIAKLEEKITYQEQLRSTISSNLNKNGEAYYKSQKQSYEYLKRQAAAQQQLALEQQDYFEKRRKELNEQNGPFSSLYHFDEEGQIKYKDGKFEWLSKLAGTNPNTGKPNYSVEQQYKKLIDAGYGKYMKYDSEGKKIDTTKVEGKKEAIEAFWDKIEADQKEMQDLHDSVEEHKKAVLEVEEKQNELLKEIQDNQIAVEDAVLNAVVSASQREIDELSKQKDAIQESNQALLDGLTSALEKERNMYENQQSEADLSSKRRKLAILQRSGGSASEISTLQAEINDATKDLYFQKQQEQIDAIQEASDLQIEKLEQQIDLQQQTLDYAKEHGLLWGKVYDVMQKTPQDIYDYISSNNPDYWSMSPTTLAQKSEEVLFQAEQWTSYRDDIGEIKDVLMGKTNKEWSAFDKMMGDSKTTSTAWNKLTSDQKDSLQKIFMDEFEASGDANKAAEAVRKSKLYTEIFGSTGSGKKSKKVKGTGGGNMVDVTGGKGGTGGKTGATYVTSRYAAKDANSHYKIDVYSDKSEKKYTEPHTLEWIYGAVSGRWDKRCTKCGYVCAVSYNTTKPQYKEGGMDYEGGEAILHGTKSRPEAVFNAEQTKVLRDNILSNKPNSLINLLKSYNEAYEGLSTSTYDSINNTDNGVTIEHAEVNVSVEKLANSYDATRAGEDIMREMLNIARKTKAQNRVGR